MNYFEFHTFCAIVVLYNNTDWIPWIAAYINGVQLSLFFAFTSAPLSMSNCATSVSPEKDSSFITILSKFILVNFTTLSSKHQWRRTVIVNRIDLSSLFNQKFRYFELVYTREILLESFTNRFYYILYKRNYQ